jgi:hypothetical protein
VFYDQRDNQILMLLDHAARYSIVDRVNRA